MIRIPLADPKTAALLREAIQWYPVHATWIDRESWELTQSGDFLVSDTAVETRVLMTLVTVVDSHVEFLRFRKRDADADLLHPVRVDVLNHCKQYRTWEELYDASA